MHVLQREIFLAHGNIALGKEAACSESKRAEQGRMHKGHRSSHQLREEAKPTGHF